MRMKLYFTHQQVPETLEKLTISEGTLKHFRFGRTCVVYDKGADRFVEPLFPAFNESVGIMQIAFEQGVEGSAVIQGVPAKIGGTVVLDCKPVVGYWETVALAFGMWLAGALF